jgi:hypothetical protein
MVCHHTFVWDWYGITVGLDYFQFSSARYGVRSAMNPQLAVDMRGMPFDGIDRDVQFSSYLGMGETGSHKPQDSKLLFRKRFK